MVSVEHWTLFWYHPGELGAFLEHSGSVGSCGKWSILTGLRGWNFMLYCWHGRCGHCGWLASMPQAAKVMAHMCLQPANQLLSNNL